MERQRFVLQSAAAVMLAAAAMAAIGLAYPTEADKPLLAFYEPLLLVSVIALVFAVALVRLAGGIVAALICASPMWMTIGAPPAGPLGAFLFFLAAFAIAGIGVVAAAILRLALSIRAR